jgi:hypothetical protein
MLDVGGSATFGDQVEVRNGSNNNQYVRINGSGSWSIWDWNNDDSSTAWHIDQDGDATFTGAIQSGGNAASGAANGSVLFGEGGLHASSSTGSQKVIRAYTTGNSTPTFSVTAAGAGTFAGNIVSGTFTSGNDYSILLPGEIRSYKDATTSDRVWEGGYGSTTTSWIRATGSATFVGDVLSGDQPSAGANTGAAVGSGGYFMASRSASEVWLGYTTGTSSPTSKIMASGAATFSGAVSGTYGHWDGSNSSYGSQLWSDSMILMRANDAAAGTYMTESATSWSSWSDERLKENITELSGALDTLKDVRCIEFSHKTDGLSEPNRYGIIAQDLIGKYDHVLSQTRLPEGDDDTEYYGVAYTELIPILIKAVQELSAKVAALEAA